MLYCDTCQLPRKECDKSPDYCEGKEEREYEKSMREWEMGVL